MSNSPAPSMTAPAPTRVRSVEPYQRYDLSALVGTMTDEEHFAFDQRTRDKYQLVAGKAIKMAGRSPEHNLIQADLQFEITLTLRTTGSTPCDVIGNDQKIYVSPRTIYYPDLIVVCGEPQFDHLNALRNPTVLVEVLGPSTERDDRTDKFGDYRTIESLLHYVLVEQDRVAVTHYEKLDNGLWAIIAAPTSLAGALRLGLDGGEISIPLARIYRRVFTQETNAPS